ncbi:MAG: neutral zinc metallopeptidase [Bacteroidota bacterium]
MRWMGRRQSDNIEDRRGASPSGKMVGGGIGTIVIALIFWLLGGNPNDILNVVQEQGGGQSTGSAYQATEQEQALAEFVGVVLGDTEDVWNELFRQGGGTYELPKLVLFSGQVESACGLSSAASGPFYCPGDKRVYIDLSFCEQLQNQLNAPGDFAVAYVIAHEVGHHVQRLMGTTDQVHQMRGRVSEKEYNQLSVRLELQADFFAGVWAHHAQRAKNILEEGDIEEALNAASAVGDDTIQKMTQGRVVPDAFTHGSSAQRKQWFYKGFKTGDVSQGDTFEDVNP